MLYLFSVWHLCAKQQKCKYLLLLQIFTRAKTQKSKKRERAYILIQRPTYYFVIIKRTHILNTMNFYYSIYLIYITFIN